MSASGFVKLLVREIMAINIRFQILVSHWFAAMQRWSDGQV